MTNPFTAAELDDRARPVLAAAFATPPDESLLRAALMLDDAPTAQVLAQYAAWLGAARALELAGLTPEDVARLHVRTTVPGLVPIAPRPQLLLAQLAPPFGLTLAREIFGALPDLSTLPAEGRPGDAAFDAMSAADQASVNRVFANFGKSIAAFERSLAPSENALDRYAAGDVDALTPLERDGLRDFFTFGCIECHSGPRLTNDSFHNVLMPGAGTGESADVGRFGAIAALRASMFRAQGAFSDAPTTPDPIEDVVPADFMRGQVRTPSLRGVAATAPYGHAGTLVDLRAVVEHYARSRMPRTDEREVGERDPHVLAFDPIAGRVDPLTALLMRL